MITIRPIHMDEIPAAKRVILTVGYGIFGWHGSLDNSINYFQSTDEFLDMDNVQSHYFDDRGTFLAAFDDEKLIGSGAIRNLELTVAELKRLWLLEPYHGKGIGFRLITMLFDFARTNGYQNVRLQTSPQQTRAISFYRQIGFFDIPTYNNNKEAVSMEISLNETK
jgi:putative acetyltransferase